MQVKKIIKNIFPFTSKINTYRIIRKRALQDGKLFFNHWINSDSNSNTTGYKIILNAHSIEKGMCSKKARRFGVQKVNTIQELVTLYEKNKWEKDYAYNLGISILREYCNFYEHHKWVNFPEYKNCLEFLQHRSTKLESGTKRITKKGFLKNALIDYDGFVSSRHSFREFSTTTIDEDDLYKAINMATKTPTACNRQMLKMYYIENRKNLEKSLKFFHGLTGFDVSTINIAIITYDISSLCFEGELMQGYFNAGLFSMNLINALHSLGIGSCMLEFGNNLHEEKELKKILNIPESEKIAVTIAFGYYPEASTIPMSTRKPIEEIYRKR